MRRVYQAEAYYRNLNGTESIVRRAFLTKRGRDQWAEKRRTGYQATSGDMYEGPIRVGPALRVDVSESDPVTFPGEVPEGRALEAYELGQRIRFCHAVHKTRVRREVQWVAQPPVIPNMEKTWREGVIVGRRSVAEGTVDWGSYDEPTTFISRRRLTVYQVAVNLAWKPWHVLPEHLEAI